MYRLSQSMLVEPYRNTLRWIVNRGLQNHGLNSHHLLPFVSEYVHRAIGDHMLAREQVIKGLLKNRRRGYNFHLDNIQNQCLANEILHRLIIGSISAIK